VGPLKRFIAPLNAPKMGLYRWGACSTPADTLAELKGREWEGSEGEKERRGPPLYEVC